MQDSGLKTSRECVDYIGDLNVIFFKMDLPEVRCDVRPELHLFRIDSDGLFCDYDHGSLGTSESK
jgi:hypothetical protein